MAATIARSIVAVRSTRAAVSFINKRLLYSTISRPPPLPGFAPNGIFIARSATPALSHSLLTTSPNLSLVNPVRCLVDSSESASSPLNSESNPGDRPPTEFEPLIPGCDFEHWLVMMDTPGGEGATKQQMIDYYIQTLAKIVGSEEEAKKRIYSVHCGSYFSFGCELDEEASDKLEGLPGVLSAIADSYVDPENKDYGGELFMNGEIVQRSPERQRRVDRPRDHIDRTRYVRRLEEWRSFRRGDFMTPFG